MRQMLFPWLSLIYLTLIFGTPTAAVACLMELAHSFYQRLELLLVAPLLYSAAMALVAGALSLPHQRYIKPARLHRKLNDPMYFHRRMYGLCWTSLFYTKPVYHLCLSVSLMKYVTFRLFGYRGATDFTVYPDTWIRDLPLLSLGAGAYISNRATLGTNLVWGRSILVDRITVAENALVGHLAMIGPGVRIGKGSDIGVGTALGMNVSVGSGTSIGGMSAVESGAELGDHVRVGACSYIGAGVRIESRVSLPHKAYVTSARREPRRGGTSCRAEFEGAERGD